LKILIVEDEPVSKRLLEVTLRKWNYEVVTTSDGREAWQLLQGPEAPNLVISDWMMPDMDGLELCKRIRESERPGYTYLILLTSKGRKEDLIKGLEAGADDYLIKPFDHEELRIRIKIGERIISLERRILQLANTDSLTGVLNRRAFMERLQIEVDRALREDSPLSIVLADLDHFKSINDQYGHQTGDLVLQKFAEQLCALSRQYDFVGRYGGEEFTICFPGLDASNVALVAERMRRNVENLEIPISNPSQFIRFTASFGTASLCREYEEPLNALIARADETMYMAKREGRNCVCVANGQALRETQKSGS
jgi:two-component system, cell cycle response regulator